MNRETYMAEDAADRRAALEAATAIIQAAAPQFWGEGPGMPPADSWMEHADHAYRWLRRRDSLTAVRIVLAGPVLTAEQATPDQTSPAQKAGPGMPTVITDTQIATYPAAQDVDSKGFPLAGAVTLTDDDTAGAIVTRADNADGSSSFSAVAPGTVNLNWTDGTLVLNDTLEVDPGAAASIQVGAPVITDQAPAAPSA